MITQKWVHQNIYITLGLLLIVSSHNQLLQTLSRKQCSLLSNGNRSKPLTHLIVVTLFNFIPSMFLSAFRYMFMICTYQCHFHFDERGAASLCSMVTQSCSILCFFHCLTEYWEYRLRLGGFLSIVTYQLFVWGNAPVFHDNLWAYVWCSIELNFLFFVSWGGFVRQEVLTFLIYWWVHKFINTAQTIQDL